jgi:PadR family transcriptional regulator, regulatory protein PadR
MARDYLTDFELMILLAILRVGDDAYGVPIAREIEETGGRTVVLGAVYAALDRLEENGLAASTVGDPTPERGGRAKRFFRVTPAGLKAVRQTQRALMNLWTGVPQLKGGRA